RPLVVGRFGAEHSRHSVERAIPEHAANVSHQRVPTAGVATKHGVEFQDERDRNRGYGHLAERTTHGEDRSRLAVGAPECRPAALSHGVVHVQRHRERSAGFEQYGDAAGEFSAGRGAALLDRSTAKGDSGARTFPGILRSGRLEGLRPADRQYWRALYAELS